MLLPYNQLAGLALLLDMFIGLSSTWGPQDVITASLGSSLYSVLENNHNRQILAKGTLVGVECIPGQYAEIQRQEESGRRGQWREYQHNMQTLATRVILGGRILC